MIDRSNPAPVPVGTRGSALALAQADRILHRLRLVHPGVAFEPRVVKTEGDIDKTSPLTVIGGRGVFTVGVQDALADGRVDVGVHSAKDLPPREPAGLVLAAFPEREDPRDVLVSRHAVGLTELPSRPRIGTSSRRRAMQVRLVRPDAEIVELRGNVDTRLRKARQGDLDAIVLAAAGVVRLGLTGQVTEWLPLDPFLPAPGQGALALEVRVDDETTRRLVAAIDDPSVSIALKAERAFLDALGAGCTTPLGVHVTADGGHWILRAMLGDESGCRVERVERSIDPSEPEPNAIAAAAELQQGLYRTVRAVSPSPSSITSATDLERGSVPDRRGTGVRNGTALAPDADGGSLAGLRVVVTRPREQARPLVDALRLRGAEPIEAPVIRIAPPRDRDSLRRAMQEARRGAYDWVVFTSGNAVRYAVEALAGSGWAGFDAGSARIAAVGRGTARELAGYGLAVDVVADPSTAEGLVAVLIERGIAGKRILYPRGDLSRDAIPVGLKRAGAVVDGVEAYRTEPEAMEHVGAVAAIAAGDVDVVTFASPSSVHALMAALDGSADALAKAAIVCIGPVTAEAARGLGLPVDAVAGTASVDAVVAAVAEHSRAHRSENRRQRPEVG